MSMRRSVSAAAVMALLLCCGRARDSQARVDTQLAAEISKIQAIDNHAHPMRAVAAGEKDDEYDALPVEMMEPSPSPVRLRPDNPEYVPAWRQLYGYPHRDMTPEHVRELSELKKKTIQERGDAYPAWILDQLGIEMMLANRVAMGRGLVIPRFRWVPFVDALMYPLNNGNLASQNPDYKTFYAGEEKLLKRYLGETGHSTLPNSLDEYEGKVITSTLERQKKSGALAVKFEAAYLRSLDFANPPKSEAARVYGRFHQAGLPTNEEYKALQDYLFRYISTECGRLGLAVHFHVAAGAGGYFQVGGTHPLLLESVLNDATLRKTNFVLVHGGWPFTKETAALLTKPNAYTDFSSQTFILYPRELAQVIRQWLEFVPEKVMFGTDASPITPELSWEETGWLSATTGREALGIALSGMLRDGEVTRERALELARMVLRDNARKLYGLK
jgi:hypothetical protein